MSVNPLASKIATPYARALYDFSVEQNIMHQVTADFQNLEVFLKQGLGGSCMIRKRLKKLILCGHN